MILEATINADGGHIEKIYSRNRVHTLSRHTVVYEFEMRLSKKTSTLTVTKSVRRDKLRGHGLFDPGTF